MRSLFVAALVLAIAGKCFAQEAQIVPLVARAVEFEGPQINPADFQGALDSNRAKWAATGITSYLLVEGISCFCPQEFRGPFDITVSNGAITAVSFSADSGLTGEPQRTGGLLTIDEAFERLQGFLNRDRPVARLSVTYDDAQGYITSFSVDIDTRIADEEQSYSFELARIISRTRPKQSLGPYSTIWTRPVQDIVPIPGSVALPKRPIVIPNAADFFDLRINRVKWNSFQPDVYMYRLFRGCFCPDSFRGPFIITVTNGRVSRAVLEGSGEDARSDVPTIDGLFEIIKESLTRTTPGGTVEVDYESSTGIPNEIVVDRAQTPVGGGFTYTAQLLRSQPKYSTRG